MTQRQNDLIKFYDILGLLEKKVGGRRKLSDCNGRSSWSLRGVYFFMEDGEIRSNTGDGNRIVRVGTHGLKCGSQSSLWSRLSQHKGNEKSGGGNHRGSIFRLIVGTAIDGDKTCKTWGVGNTANREIRAGEISLERRVSEVIRAMPFIWLPLNDAPSPDSLRGYIERNSIGLLSNYQREKIDAPSLSWLGHQCNRERVRYSGLWNQNHVDEVYQEDFLEKFKMLVDNLGDV